MSTTTSYLLSFWRTVLIYCLISIIFSKVVFAIPPISNDTIMVSAKIWGVNALHTESNTAGFDYEKAMPWIAALLIGIFTVFTNLYVSRRARISNLAIVERQITNAQAIALDQIEQSRQNSVRDFNKTVISGTRQNWINDLRESISEILALNSKFLLYQNISDEDANKLWLEIAKVELLLISSEYGGLSAIIKALEHCCKQIQIGNQPYECIEDIISRLKAEASLVLKNEWQYIKSGL